MLTRLQPAPDGWGVGRGRKERTPGDDQDEHRGLDRLAALVRQPP